MRVKGGSRVKEVEVSSKMNPPVFNFIFVVNIIISNMVIFSL